MMMVLPVVEVSAPLRQCFPESFNDSRIKMRVFLFYVLDIPRLVRQGLISRSRLVPIMRCGITHRDRQLQQTVYNPPDVRRNGTCRRLVMFAFSIISHVLIKFVEI